MTSQNRITLPSISELFKDPFANATQDKDKIEAVEGSKCELTFCDVKYNAKGERIYLHAGSKKTFDKPDTSENRFSALVVTRVYDKRGNLDYLETFIHSRHIRNALAEVVGPDYHGLNLKSEVVAVRDFERLLYFHHRDLRDYGRGLQDEEAAHHINLALEYLYETSDRSMRLFRENVENALESEDMEPALDWKNYWMLFRPGDLVVYKNRDVDLIGRVRCTEYLDGFLGLKFICRYETLGCNGESFGYENSSTLLRPDQSVANTPLSELAVRPLKHLRPAVRQAIIDDVRERGERFVKLSQEVTQCNYAGLARLLTGDPDDEWLAAKSIDKRIKGRVMIDSRRFAEERPENLESLATIRTLDEANTDPLKPEDVLLAQCEVLGFSLADKRWGYFRLECIKDIQFNKDAFEKLILPPLQKDTIRALVSAHERGGLDFDDVIEGKGQGMIMLLHGTPGVGKTLTAESVAEYVKRPLYGITAADISSSASATEISLKKVFDLAAHWNAVLLIDEADVFLSERTVADVQRNAIIASFLRALEYYSGVLMLTTNRVLTIDTAFRSRIHLAIKFRPLAFETRGSIWRAFIGRVTDCDRERCLDVGVVNELAKHPIDGRMIKNAVRTAYALAADAKKPMDPSHLRVAVEALTQFVTDINAEMQAEESRGNHQETGVLDTGAEASLPDGKVVDTRQDGNEEEDRQSRERDDCTRLNKRKRSI